MSSHSKKVLCSIVRWVVWVIDVWSLYACMNASCLGEFSRIGQEPTVRLLEAKLSMNEELSVYNECNQNKWAIYLCAVINICWFTNVVNKLFDLNHVFVRFSKMKKTFLGVTN